MSSIASTSGIEPSITVPSTSSASATSASGPGQPPPQPLQLQLLQQERGLARQATCLSPQSPALRPEDLRVRPWYTLVDEQRAASKDSPPDRSSAPAHNHHQSNEQLLQDGNHKDAATASRAPPATIAEAASTRTSSMESEAPRSAAPRKAYMDLNDAIALLDETCPNPDVSPQMTPRTPRTPLTPHPRNKRARSKSSDNSSNYSSERLNENMGKDKEKDRKRPFLKKLGMSMTDDKPLLLQKFGNKIRRKPYLSSIGPSRAVERPFLEKIGPSRTLDKFVFDTPKRREASETRATIPEEPERKASTAQDRRDEIRGFTANERRRSGKNFLLKMYSFETEDLEDAPLAAKAPHRDPLRGASLDDVLESSPSSSMPRIDEAACRRGVIRSTGANQQPHQSGESLETPSASVAELVRCRVTTSEEIISSSSCLNSPMERANSSSWGNSPSRRKGPAPKKQTDESVPNSPTKRTHSVTPEKVTAVYRDLERVKNGRQSSDEILDKRKSRFDQFETRSSDNLVLGSKERVATPVFAEIGAKNLNGKGSSSSVMSSASSTRQQPQDKFDSQQEIFRESYAEFKLRTQGNLNTSNALKRLVVREKTISPSFDLGFSSKEAMLEKIKSEGSPKVRSKSAETERQKQPPAAPNSNNRRTRNRSVLRKQQGVDHPEPETVEQRPQRKMVHEPSQETLDLLTELQKVKSQLRTTSVDKTYELDTATELKSFPKRVLLTDKEFCLSVERENSVRRPQKNDGDEDQGAALFEKRCLSLDYADDEKSVGLKTEPRAAISLASARSPRSEDLQLLETAEIGLITSDSKSYSSDVFNSPDEPVDKTILDPPKKKKQQDEVEAKKKDRSKSPRSSENEERNNTEPQVSPRKKNDSQQDVASPKATPFRMKKRLGRISVEETVKQESFTVNKVECNKEAVAAVQKKAKCLPL